MVRQEQGDKIFEDVRARYGLAKLVQKSLQVLFATLLGVKTDFIVMRFASARDVVGDHVVRFCFSHPLDGQPSHRALCPLS
jgi:hypothetical protein